MDRDTGEFHSLPEDHEQMEKFLKDKNLVGPFERGDPVTIGNVVMTHQFGLTVRVAQVGAVVEHLGQKFRVMKLENGNAVLRSLVQTTGMKKHDPAKAAAADEMLTDQVMEDGEEFCSEAELVEEDAATADLRRQVEKAQSAMDAENSEPVKDIGMEPLPMATTREPDELDKQLTEDKKIMDDLCAIEEGLSDWEVAFIEDVTRKVEQGDTLSPAQRDKANEILTEKE